MKTAGGVWGIVLWMLKELDYPSCPSNHAGNHLLGFYQRIFWPCDMHLMHRCVSLLCFCNTRCCEASQRCTCFNLPPFRAILTISWKKQKDNSATLSIFLFPMLKVTIIKALCYHRFSMKKRKPICEIFVKYFLYVTLFS